MEHNPESKLEFKEKLKDFYYKNKGKIFFSILVLLIFLISVIFIKYNDERKKKFVSEKYIQAGLYLVSDKKENAKKLYEEIILNEDNFYSILALNIIIEKNLISDENKILEYFNLLEKSNLTSENIDLLNLKKSLYLINNSNIEMGENLLKSLKNKDTSLKPIIEEILKK
tara:strand:- start:6877 stop:7386 length:510 start_codon:yes stop_codon:yes gene_type:complete